jgi:hypothetical protein
MCLSKILLNKCVEHILSVTDYLMSKRDKILIKQKKTGLTLFQVWLNSVPVQIAFCTNAFVMRTKIINGEIKMFNSKLTKIAAALALTAAAGTATANTLTIESGRAGDSNSAAVGVTVGYEAGASKSVAYQALVGQPQNNDANMLVYTAVTTGVVSGNLIQFDFTNGGIEDITDYKLAIVDATATATNVADQNDANPVTYTFGATGVEVDEVTATLTGKTAANGVATQLQFVLSGSIGLGDKVVLLKGTIGANHDIVAADLPDLYVNAGLADGAKATVTAKALNSGYVDIANTDTDAVDLFEADEGLAVVAITADTQSVDFANDSFVFLDDGDGSTTNYQSLAKDFRVHAATLDIGLTLDASDNYTVTVTADACNAVETNDADAVQVGIDGTGWVNLTYQSGCTWSLTDDAASANFGAAINAGTADIRITTNGGAADATDTGISTANWTYSVSTEVNDGATNQTYNSITDAGFATWSGDVQGGKVTVPYVYTSSSDKSQSYVSVSNNDSSDIKVGMNVRYTDKSGETDTVTVYSNYYLGTVAANTLTTWTAKEIVARLNAADGAAEEGFNTTALTLDADILAHMSVELVFQNETAANDLDKYEVNAFNRADNARYAVGVSYDDNGRSKVK